MNSSGDHIMRKRGVNAMTRRDLIVGGTAALALWTSARLPLRAQAGEIQAVERVALPVLPTKPGHVSGRLIDLRGKPLRQRVAINIFGTTFAGQGRAFTIEATEGRYEIALQAGAVDAVADFTDLHARLTWRPQVGSSAGPYT